MFYKNIRVRNKHFYAIYRSYNIIYYKLEIVYYDSIHAHMMRLLVAYNAKNNKSKFTNKLIGTKRNNKSAKLFMREMCFYFML